MYTKQIIIKIGGTKREDLTSMTKRDEAFRIAIMSRIFFQTNSNSSIKIKSMPSEV